MKTLWYLDHKTVEGQLQHRELTMAAKIVMKEMKELENELSKINAPILKFFNEGLSEQEVISLFHKVNLRPSKELVNLYHWRNGLKFTDVPIGKISFGINGAFLPLEKSIEMYQNHFVEGFPLFFPIFWDDTILINLNPESKGYLKIFIYSPSLLITEPESCYDSFSLMIRTFSTCFQKGIFTYDVEEYFQQEYKMTTEVAKTINPFSDFWK